MMNMILSATSIKKFFRQSENVLHILKGIELQVEEGEVVAVVGPSGAGKSTLLHILGGLDVPDEGEVLLCSQNVFRLNDVQRSKLRNESIGFVFQFYHLLPEFTALENVILPVLIKEDKRKDRKVEDKGLEMLERVGLKDRVHHKPQQLSGGEQQRVAIARALINEPKVVFCDEPTGNLDSRTGGEIIKLLMDLNRKNRQTFVIVTHDESISELAHRTLFMKDGQLIEQNNNAKTAVSVK
jgi:lipoprotein-releasing system ATP-binding protein